MFTPLYIVFFALRFFTSLHPILSILVVSFLLVGFLCLLFWGGVGGGGGEVYAGHFEIEGDKGCGGEMVGEVGVGGGDRFFGYVHFGGFVCVYVCVCLCQGEKMGSVLLVR